MPHDLDLWAPKSIWHILDSWGAYAWSFISGLQSVMHPYPSSQRQHHCERHSFLHTQVCIKKFWRHRPAPLLHPYAKSASGYDYKQLSVERLWPSQRHYYINTQVSCGVIYLYLQQHRGNMVPAGTLLYTNPGQHWRPWHQLSGISISMCQVSIEGLLPP